MKVTTVVGALLLWQNALLVNIGTAAVPQHLRFQRELLFPAGVAGPVCAPLDAEVFAHTASAAHLDLRVFRHEAGSASQAETPYLFTESGPEPVADAEAPVTGAARHGNTLRFDLHMPARAYTEVDLHLRLHDFVATAVVSGNDPAGRPQNLGTFGLFDLTRQGLGTWTVLALAETSTPVLHVALRLRTPGGKPLGGVPPSVVAGAGVPPSRERQTVFTPVATAGVAQRGTDTVAIFGVSAHVPVERIGFGIAPGYSDNYRREVSLRARTEGDPAADIESLDAGAIQHVRWAPGDPGLNPIDVTENSVDATTGATLAGPATIRVAVANGLNAPLPIQRVTLEMREREVCFHAMPGARYTLRYGDPALQAPVYDTASLLPSGQRPAMATLGPEQRNPRWQRRGDDRPYLDRHPEVFWLILLVCGGSMGASALHFVQHRVGREHG